MADLNFSLEGRVAIVTGGGTGIGHGIVLGLAQAGADIVVAGRRLEPLEQTCEEVRRLGRRALAVQADVTRTDDTRTIAARTLDTFDRIDILVNNAGASFSNTFHRGPLLDLTEQDIDGCLALNVKGVVLCAQAVVPHMLQRGKGAIVNIASIGGREIAPPSVGFGMYGPAKAAVVMLTREMAAEWGPQVRVNAIAPGMVATPRVAALGTDTDPNVMATVSMQRMGRPEDIAGAVVYLASDAASWTTGAVIDVNGGLKSPRRPVRPA